MAESDVEKVKDRLSINEVVGQYVQLKRAGRNYTARCPFHKEKTPSFFVSPERGSYICFGCSEKGDIFSFVQKIEGVDFPTALKQLSKQAGVELSRTVRVSASGVEERDERLRALCEEAAVFFERELLKRSDAFEYLRSRGVSDETSATWRIGYAPASWEELVEHLGEKDFSKNEIVDAGFGVRSQKREGEIFDRFRGRVMFPIFDTSGRVIAFSGRFFEQMKSEAHKTPAQPQSEPAKYVNSPETAIFKKSRTLYGLDKARVSIRKADCVLLVEGQFDVILCHQSGLPFTVALSGTALTPEHLSILGRLTKRLVLALDADEAGLRSGLKSAQMALASGFDVKIPTFPPGKDPADLARQNPELLKAAVRTSKTAVEFFLDALRLGTRDERAYKKVVEASVLPLIRSIESTIDQEHFIRLVAGKLMVSEAAVRTEVNRSLRLQPMSEEPALPQAKAQMTSLEKAAGMLLFHFEKNEAMLERLRELVGSERMSSIKEKCKESAERLRFEFDALGEEVAASEALLTSIERAVLEEEMQGIRQSLMSETQPKHGEMMKKLTELKRRQEELRK